MKLGTSANGLLESILPRMHKNGNNSKTVGHSTI